MLADKPIYCHTKTWILLFNILFTAAQIIFLKSSKTQIISVIPTHKARLTVNISINFIIFECAVNGYTYMDLIPYDVPLAPPQVVFWDYFSYCLLFLLCFHVILQWCFFTNILIFAVHRCVPLNVVCNLAECRPGTSLQCPTTQHNIVSTKLMKLSWMLF